jgi:hypothetical protein
MKVWFEPSQAPPAVVKGYAMMAETHKNRKPMDDKACVIYFGQSEHKLRPATFGHKHSAGSNRRRVPSWGWRSRRR